MWKNIYKDYLVRKSPQLFIILPINAKPTATRFMLLSLISFFCTRNSMLEWMRFITQHRL